MIAESCIRSDPFTHRTHKCYDLDGLPQTHIIAEDTSVTLPVLSVQKCGPDSLVIAQKAINALRYHDAGIIGIESKGADLCLGWSELK